MVKKVKSFLKDHYKNIGFWVGIAIILICGAYLAWLDTKNIPAECHTEGFSRSAFLVVNELDTSAKQIRVSLLILGFDQGKDTLIIEAVVPGVEENEISYEKRLLSTPSQPLQRPSNWFEVHFPYNSRSFFYPFERYVVDLHITLQVSGTDVPLKIQIRNKCDELIVQNCLPHYSFENTPLEINSFSLTFSRHRFVRATAAILFIVAILFLIYLLRREGISKVLSNSLGYIAALWGIREIIVGSVKLFPTIVDFLTLGLYVFVVAIVAYKWLFNSKQTTSNDGRGQDHSDENE